MARKAVTIEKVLELLDDLGHDPHQVAEVTILPREVRVTYSHPVLTDKGTMPWGTSDPF